MSKKYLLITYLLSLILVKGYSQINQASNKIRLSIITPENIDNLDNSQLSRLNSKFFDIVTQSGFSGDGLMASSFVVYPKVLVNEMRESDGGLFRIFAVSIDVTIVVLQYNTKTVFQSITIELKGSGDSRRLAIDNAIKSMKVKSDEYNKFFTSVRNKIVDFYKIYCEDILKIGSSLVAQNNYSEAFSTYFSIPSEVDCFDKVRPMIISAFKQYQTTKCLENLQNAKARFGARDFSGALTFLARIDPESKCNAESNKLINECFKNVSEEEARNFNFLKDVYKTEKELEARRIDAARDIAVEYYRTRPTQISYNSIMFF